jgi:hypothetical protein
VLEEKVKDAIEIKGIWWLPEVEDNKLPGILSFSQDNGAFLEIVGELCTERTGQIEQPVIILGITQQSRPITLYKCIFSKGTYPLGGLGGGKYRVQIIFEGVHFESEAEIKFNQLCGNYTDLDSWVDINGFTIELENTDEKFISKIRYEKPSSRFFDIGDTFVVGINFSSHGPNISTVQNEITISQRAYLVVKSKTGDISFENLFAQLNIFCYLLQSAIQRVPYPITVFGFSHKNGQEKDRKEPYYPKINIYYEPIEALVIQKSKLPQEMLFTFKDLDANQIKTWFCSFEKFEIIIHLYRSLFYKDRLFIENRFLNIVWALESLHSILFDNTYLSKDEFTSQKNKALQCVPDDLQEWVEAALSGANYKRFRLKILELFSYKAGYFSECIKDYDIELFTRKVTNTRNKFVHHNEQKWAFQNNEELLSAIGLMTMLFESYLLEIIGFSTDKVRELLKPKIQTYLTGWKHLRSGIN